MTVNHIIEPKCDHSFLADATFSTFARLTLAALDVARAFENIEEALRMTAATLEEIKVKGKLPDDN